MEKNYTHIIKSLMEEIEDKILSTENWIYYFWNITEIQEYLIDNSNDWKDECRLSVVELNDDHVKVNIETPENLLYYKVLYFDTFEQGIENNISKNIKDILSSRLIDKKHSKYYYLEIIESLDKEISELENKLRIV